MRRRDFLKLSATSAVGAVIFQACSFDDWGDGDPDREFDLQSPREIPEDYLFNGDAWYASVSPQSADAPGVIVRVFEGRAKKIEGNPNHPVNAGKLDAHGQAILQDLYHPDRLRGPRRRQQASGPNSFDDLTWNEALDELSQIVQDSQGSALFITSPLSGAMRQVVDGFVEAIGGERIVFETIDEAVLHEALNRVFGSPQIPTFDIANAQFVLSFGANWLHTWLSPVQFSRAYGAFRRSSEGSPRGMLYHVDTHMSGTAGVADRWVSVRPGYEGILALAVARVLIDEGMASDEAGFNAVIGGQTLPTPEEAAEQTGVSADMIREIAQHFGEGPSLAFGGGSAGAHSNGLANLIAIYALNVLAGNVNQPGGIQLPASLPEPLQGLERDIASSVPQWQETVTRLQNGEFETVFIYDANPVYGLPPGLGLEAALQMTPNVVSFSRYLDETSNLARLYLPDNSALESWGTVVPRVSPGYPVVGIQQPVVLRFYDTQPTGDVLLTIAEEAGFGDALPWATMQDVVREQAEALRGAGGGNIQASGNATDFWTELLQTGVWMDQEAAAAGGGGEGGQMPPIAPPQYGGEEGEYPYFLVPYESPTLGAGQHAHLPWLQGLPDPLTTVTWASWANLNPDTAEELGVGLGDFVRVSTIAGMIELQTYVTPGTPPNVVAIPMGQGHAFYTRYAEGRGVNVLTLLDPAVLEPETGTLAWAGLRANVQRVPGESRKLPRMEGVVEMVSPEDYEVVRRVPPSGTDH